MGLYCGIDLHSNNHVMTVIDERNRRLYEPRLPEDLAITRAAAEPFRAQLVAVAGRIDLQLVLVGQWVDGCGVRGVPGAIGGGCSTTDSSTWTASMTPSGLRT